MTRALTIALWLAANGVHVFPLRPLTKRPLANCEACRAEQCIPGTCPCTVADRPCHGLLAATNNTELIERWWTANPRANVGIHAGRSDLVILDLDRKDKPAAPAAADVPTKVTDGLAALRAIAEAADEPVPETLTVATPSRGRHLHFRAPGGMSVPSDATGRVGHQIDVRAEGGYVVAPGGQLHAPPEDVSGIYQRVSPDCEITPLPEWLLTRVLPPVPEHPKAPNLGAARPGAHQPGYWAAVWEGEIRKVELEPGERWRLVYNAARRLANLAAHDTAPWNESDVVESLTDSAIRRRRRTGKSIERATARRNAVKGWRRGTNDGPESLTA